jgi:hypothetical protein
VLPAGQPAARLEVEPVKKFIKFIVVTAFVLGGWVLAAASLHVVRAPGKMVFDLIPMRVEFIPKSYITFTDTYVDTTKWTQADVASHSAFKDRLDQAGKGFLLDEAIKTPAPVVYTPPAKSPETFTTSTPATDAPAVKTEAKVETPKADTPKPKSIFDFSGQKK